MYFLRYSVVALMFEWTPCLWCCAGQPNLHSPSNIGSVKYYFFCTFCFFFTLHRYYLWIRVIMADPTLFQSTPSLRFLLSGLRISCDWSNTCLKFSSDMWVDPLLMMLCRATQSPLSLHVLVLVLSPRTPFWTHFYFFWCAPMSLEWNVVSLVAVIEATLAWHFDFFLLFSQPFYSFFVVLQYCLCETLFFCRLN